MRASPPNRVIRTAPTFGLLTLLSSAPVETLAQDSAQRSCTYRACALRIEGDRILQGVEGREVGDLGAFYNDLRILREKPDSATYYANVYESNSKRDFWLSLSGGVLVAAGHVLGPDETDQIGSLIGR